MAALPPPRPCSTTAAVRAGSRLNPAAGKIYWANWNSGEIRVANLDGTGTASTLFAAPGNNLCGVAVDPAAGKIYWANFSTNEIRVGNLNGTGAVDPVHRPGRERPERGSDRPREQQDLLDEPVLRRGSGREPGRLGHRPDPV